MYHDNPRINDIMLTVINDGDGTQCGYTYERRVAMGASGDLFGFRLAAQNYARYATRNYGSSRATLAETSEAGDRLLAYYADHVRESAAAKKEGLTMTAPKPATPLPFSVGAGTLVSDLRSLLDAQGRTIAVFSDRFDAQDIAEYLLIPANEYPRLQAERDALKEALQGVLHDRLTQTNLHQMPPQIRQRIEKARALLARLEGART